MGMAHKNRPLPSISGNSEAVACLTQMSGYGLGNVQIRNVQIRNDRIGNVQIGNVQIGNVQIDNVQIGNEEIFALNGTCRPPYQQYQQSTGAPELYQTGQYTDQLYPLHAYNDIHFVALHVLRRGCPAPHRLAYTDR